MRAPSEADIQAVVLCELAAAYGWERVTGEWNFKRRRMRGMRLDAVLFAHPWDQLPAIAFEVKDHYSKRWRAKQKCGWYSDALGCPVLPICSMAEALYVVDLAREVVPFDPDHPAVIQTNAAPSRPTQR